MLTGPERAATQTAKRLVIFLHGYGSNGNDLIGLAPFFAQIDPEAAFASPNANQPSPFNPGGFQWFPIPFIDGSSASAMAAGLSEAMVALDQYVTAKLGEFELTPAELILIGFSQGTMMALEYALTRRAEFAGVIGFSGRLLSIDDIETRLKAKPPIVLIHGEADDVVPISDSVAAFDRLSALGLDVHLHRSKNTAHSIAEDGLRSALEFYQRHVLATPDRA